MQSISSRSCRRESEFGSNVSLTADAVLHEPKSNDNFIVLNFLWTWSVFDQCKFETHARIYSKSEQMLSG